MIVAPVLVLIAILAIWLHNDGSMSDPSYIGTDDLSRAEQSANESEVGRIYREFTTQSENERLERLKHDLERDDPLSTH